MIHRSKSQTVDNNRHLYRRRASVASVASTRPLPLCKPQFAMQQFANAAQEMSCILIGATAGRGLNGSQNAK